MVPVPEFATAVVPLGTTAVFVDPHEIANVMGLSGIEYILQASQEIPLDVFIMLPSCVPASDLGTSGARLEAEDLKKLMNHPRVLGLGEMMNFPGVLDGDPKVLAKLKLAEGKVIDGHAPGLSGPDLCAYIACGIISDHESISLKEAAEKLKLGMKVMIREGLAKNLSELLPVVNDDSFRRCMFATDDRNPKDLLDEGHVNFLVKKAIREGLKPIRAVQLATINVAEHFGLRRKGAVAPGFKADLVVIDNPKDFNVRLVFKDGKLVAREGKFLVKMGEFRVPRMFKTFRVKHLRVENFRMKAHSSSKSVIGLIPGQIYTRCLKTSVRVEDGLVVSDVENDLIKVAVIERHRATGNIGLGLVKGFGLKRGAIGSSVSHDCHNLVVLGTNDRDMLAVSRKIVEMAGGLAIVSEGKILDSLAFPIAGLMSDKPINYVKEKLEDLERLAHSLGVKVANPFMVLSFLALEVIPELKITDRGLVDVGRFQLIKD
jgi:adenine deaminase